MVAAHQPDGSLRVYHFESIFVVIAGLLGSLTIGVWFTPATPTQSGVWDVVLILFARRLAIQTTGGPVSITSAYSGLTAAAERVGGEVAAYLSGNGQCSIPFERQAIEAMRAN